MENVGFRNINILLLLWLWSFQPSPGQTIEVLNIPSTYGSRNVSFQGFTLEGSYLVGATSKLLEPSNFGLGGTIENNITITHGFEDLGSIVDLNQLNTYDIIFIGSVFSNVNAFTSSEIDVLKNWSAQEKKVLIIAEQPVGKPISTAFNLPLIAGNTNPTTATPEDVNRNIHIFSGPFGNVSQITQSGNSQGYFSESCNASALARNADGNATILYDATYNDIFIADTGYFTNQNSQMQNNTSINTEIEIAWGNLWAWAIREVLTGVSPGLVSNEGETLLTSECINSYASIELYNNFASIIRWETSYDNGATWVEISTTDNPLIFPDPIDGQVFRAVTSNDVNCPDFFSSATIFNPFDIPDAYQPQDIEICDDIDNNGIEHFDLTVQNEIILGPQSPQDFTVYYYRDSNRTDLILDAELTTFTNTTNPQEIFARVEHNTGLCTNDDISFLIIVNAQPIAFQPNDLFACAHISDGTLGTFDLSIQNSAILGTQSESNFNVRYFRDALRLDEITIEQALNFVSTTNPQEIFVLVENNEADCIDNSISFELITYPFPILEIEDQYLLCLDANDNVIDPVNTTFVINPPIDTELSENEYAFQWYNGPQISPTNLIDGETNNSYFPSAPGTYTVHVTNINTQCTTQASTVVVESYPPESIEVEVISSLFSENSSIEVVVIGNGSYEYRLNASPWQTSNMFNDVYGCENIVFVRDISNCNVITYDVGIVGYPKFFTPNNDGTNDYWNVTCPTLLENAKIYIYDRYGKLLKQLSPFDKGWDGTYNGRNMPTNDYWFLVEYRSTDNLQKQFRAHFSLKR
ncbi:T9SS type B sorting domain-containing protein [Winogradskyella sp.]|uniref:T9SS type B sorting domain-containing protein n=1 Tax=Winogradskyella sp. TaxID=1883156 RepID=UPI003BACDE68